MNAPDLLAGTPYRVRRMLGEGGMGEVYEVEHEVVGKLMVAKILRAEFRDDPGLVDRMRVEAQALAALSHPNIVNVTDFSRTSDGRPFYVMEYLNGCTVGDELRARGALPVHEAVEIARQALRALGAAHQLGLVHRDIKLENLFLHTTPAGERVVKVLDFGVAKVLTDEDGKNARGPAPPVLPTADGAVVGTPRYVSPEQVRGKAIDHRADVYAMGLVLYVMVCGRGPFDHLRRPEDLFIAHLSDTPDPPSKHVPGVLPDDLDHAILCALAKDPGGRFQTAAAFEAALGVIAEHWNAPIGWLDTALSPPPMTQAPSLREPTTPYAPLQPPVREAIANAAPPASATAALGPQTVASPGVGPAPQNAAAPIDVAVLPTRTAPPPVYASHPAAPTSPNPAISPTHAPAKWPYGAAALAAVVVSGVGLWLTQASSILALILVPVASITAAAVTAMVATRLADLRRR